MEHDSEYRETDPTSSVRTKNRTAQILLTHQRPHGISDTQTRPPSGTGPPARKACTDSPAQPALIELNMFWTMRVMIEARKSEAEPDMKLSSKTRLHHGDAINVKHARLKRVRRLVSAKPCGFVPSHQNEP